MPGLLCRIFAARTRNQRTLAEIEFMLDTLVESEREPDLVQISGGEPTIHPQIMEILRLAKSKPIRHIMLNTNGIRIARDKDFVKQLAELRPGFEVYLQFDSHAARRRWKICAARISGASASRRWPISKRPGISTTLVCVIKKGVNDNEIGDIVRHALTYSCVRGITFQPIQDAGRNEGFDKNTRPHAAHRHPPRRSVSIRASSTKRHHSVALQSR